MNYKRIKNGYQITVKRWSSEVVVTEIATGKRVVTSFGDHIKAVAVAQAV